MVLVARLWMLNCQGVKSSLACQLNAFIFFIWCYETPQWFSSLGTGLNSFARFVCTIGDKWSKASEREGFMPFRALICFSWLQLYKSFGQHKIGLWQRCKLLKTKRFPAILRLVTNQFCAAKRTRELSSDPYWIHPINPTRCALQKLSGLIWWILESDKTRHALVHDFAAKFVIYSIIVRCWPFWT